MTTPMTCDQFADSLQDLLEHDATADAQAAALGHASTCADCGALLDELRAVTAGAARLPAMAPPRDLWSGIAARIETRVEPLSRNIGAVADLASHRRTMTGRGRRWMLQGLAAAALVVATATITYRLTTREMGPDAPAVASVKAPDAANGAAASTDVRLASVGGSIERAYEREIELLRAVLADRRSKLDAKTIAVVERNLTAIDQAIEECAAALSSDPESVFLVETLGNAYRAKVELLRTAATLPVGA